MWVMVATIALMAVDVVTPHPQTYPCGHYAGHRLCSDMTICARQLHIVFSPSAAGTIRKAMADAGRSDLVACPFDDFSFGPIANDDADTRARWVEDVLGYPDWADVAQESRTVLDASLAAREPPIVWISSTSTRSLSGFMWWLSHMGDMPCRLLDIPILNLLNANEILPYLEGTMILSPSYRFEMLASWQRLRREDAPLRILANGKLASAPITYFDEALLANARPEWQKMARIVAGVLGAFHESEVWQTSDLVLAARLFDLADSGVLEWRGELGQMSLCEMRLLGSR